MSDATSRRASALGQLLLAVVLAGAVLSGVILPWVGGPGIVARNATELLDQVPEELAAEPPAGISPVLASDGQVITYFYERYRVPVTIDQIPEVMQQAIVATEDVRFYQHNGLDVQGVLRALLTNVVAGEVQEGASTITQQLVKLTLLETADTQEERSAATEESITRKLKEARLALAVEEQLSKDEILTRYLNIAYFGQGAYGIAAAAQIYFSKPVTDLTLPEAALLAGLVQSPADYDPTVELEAATQRRDTVLSRMESAGFITADERQVTTETPIALAPGVAPPNGCLNAAISGFFCDFLEKYLTNDLQIPLDQLKRGSLTIQTTLSAPAQAAGDAAVLNTLALEDSRAGIFTLQEPGTGKVRALSVNRIYGADTADPRQTTVNLPTVASAGSGSTYKVFTTAEALSRGSGTGLRLNAPSPYTSSVYTNGGAPYQVRNVGTYAANLDLETALYQSSNTYFLALEDYLGSIEGPVRQAQAMGLYSIDANAEQIIAENRGSFTFGAEATSPLALGTAYATLAASGTRCYPTPVEQILDRSGVPLTREDGTPYVDASNCTPESISPAVANTMNQMLVRDVAPGNPGQTGSGARIDGYDIAGKTGTSQNNFSVAFVGYTSQLVGSVMVYNPLVNEDVGGFGGGKGAEIWRNAMVPILAGQPNVPFPPADPTVINGNTVVLRANCVGGSPDSCVASLQGAGFTATARTVPGPPPAGVVIGTNPGNGARVAPGTQVTVDVSDGSQVPAPPPPPAVPAPPPGQPPPNNPVPPPNNGRVGPGG